MGHNKVYGICENKCFVEVATKKEIPKEIPYVENEESELQQNVIIQPAGKWFDGEHEISRIYIPTLVSDWTFADDFITSNTAMSASLYNKIDWSKVLSGFTYVNYRGLYASSKILYFQSKYNHLSIKFLLVQNFLIL